MSADQSGLRWPAWPVAGAVGAGRRDEVPALLSPGDFVLTPSATAERENAMPEEAPGEGPE